MLRAMSVLPSSLLRRDYPSADASEIVSAAAPAPPTERVPEDVDFAGYLFPHFGHFLLESLSRLWITRQYPELPVVWCRRQTAGSAAYNAWQEEVLDLLGSATVRSSFALQLSSSQ